MELSLFDNNGAFALITIIHFPHLGEIVEPADDVRRPESLACFDLPAV
jgi:hypothetical protein